MSQCPKCGEPLYNCACSAIDVAGAPGVRVIPRPVLSKEQQAAVDVARRDLQKAANQERGIPGEVVGIKFEDGETVLEIRVPKGTAWTSESVRIIRESN